MIKMKCFQIEKNEVLIIDGEKQYVDTIENFKKDSGIKSLPVRVWYNNEQPNVVIKTDEKAEEEWKSYPIAEYDDYIAAIDEYMVAKEKREYVPPTFEELKEQALNYQYGEYVKQRDALVYVDGMGFTTDAAGQQDWQIALTLMGDSGQYKVYDADGKTATLQTVTKSQMMAAGDAARAQQLAAYSCFVTVRENIKNCQTVEDLQAYLPQETA
nr:MAG TPA: protein of unknown function (DUF4376) [Caudoviricetes sp.]